ncbi:MAG: ABC transporter ATP-binding protein [Actinomycetota bacterium]|nr:ABC transporter ATP-binding protein [Actinomycetota bacterium]MDK1016728.1 ABC transporter ATP-binding protein [Actinomycetota bacterium]MDK1038452.1 ABC transporter ATP-binding protein [Actinomycetota bacterium]MDK1292713.1 ABC transporter ATP-binding protein [Actinomycetota bacterium]
MCWNSGMSVIEVQDLVKHYGEIEAVAGVDLSIDAGEVFALLGPNGAGKTTIVEILEGHRTKTSGSVSVLGCDPAKAGRAYRERIGIVLQATAVEEQLTVEEAIDLYGSLYPKQRKTGELIELVGLEEKTHSRIKALSGGQRRRLEFALGIVGDPEVIFLDEPTTGFDPSARRQAWSIVENLTALGKTVLLTTHYMDEAQRLADRVAVIVKGKIVAEGTPETLGGRESATALITFEANGRSIEELPLSAGVATLSENGRVTVRSMDPTRDLHQITGWAIERGVELSGLTVTRPSLEDIYLELTGGTGGV